MFSFSGKHHASSKRARSNVRHFFSTPSRAARQRVGMSFAVRSARYPKAQLFWAFATGIPSKSSGTGAERFRAVFIFARIACRPLTELVRLKLAKKVNGSISIRGITFPPASRSARRMIFNPSDLICPSRLNSSPWRFSNSTTLWAISEYGDA